MHWDKSQPAAETRSRPYQGVRVRDPVKELLRRKRSVEPASSKTAAVDVGAFTTSTSYSQGLFIPESPAVVSDGGLQCSGWKAVPTSSSTVLPASVMPWSSPECSQQEHPAQNQAYPAAPTLTTDLYMQTLCPSYTMLTYTSTPLLTNFGTIPVAPAPSPLPQVDPDSGLTYLPWGPPLSTISTIPSPGVQFTSASAAFTAPPLVHVPLPMSLATMIPQVDLQISNGEPQTLDQQLDPVTEGQSLEDDPSVEQDSPNLLDKLLEDQNKDGGEDKDSYSNSIFILNV